MTLKVPVIYGLWNRGSRGAPPTFGTGEQAIALAPQKV